MVTNIYIVLLAFAQVYANEQTCESVLINGISYKKEVLKTGIDSPYQFSLDYNTNTLFFSYSSTATKDQTFQSAYINLNTNEFKTIPIVNGFASAVDVKNKKNFLGGTEGIYEFNLKTKQTNHLGGSNHNVWQMFYKNGLYYTVYPTEEAYFFKDGTFQKLTELEDTKVMLIAVGGNENIYFTNSSGLFNYDKLNKKVHNLSKLVINGINADKNGKLYFSTPNDIFTINEDLNTVERVVALESVFSVAIEEDGSLLYGTDDGIVRLKKNDKCKILKLK